VAESGSWQATPHNRNIATVSKPRAMHEIREFAEFELTVVRKDFSVQNNRKSLLVCESPGLGALLIGVTSSGKI